MLRLRLGKQNARDLQGVTQCEGGGGEGGGLPWVSWLPTWLLVCQALAPSRERLQAAGSPFGAIHSTVCAYLWPEMLKI